VLLSGTGLARNPHLTYSGTSVLLTLDPGLLSPSLSGANINQRNVAAGIDNALAGGANPPAAFNALLGANGATLNNALTQASGEHATGIQQTSFDAMGSFVATLLDPFSHLGNTPTGSGVLSYADAGGVARQRAARDAFASLQRKAPLGATDAATRWNVWAAGYGGAQNADGNAIIGSHTTNGQAYGVAAGADSDRTQSSDSHLAAEARVTGSTAVSGAGAPIYSRPAHSSGTISAKATLPVRWPMDGRTSRQIGPLPSPALIAFKAASMPTRCQPASRQAVATNWPGPR
jgi:hypothetical protein